MHIRSNTSVFIHVFLGERLSLSLCQIRSHTQTHTQIRCLSTYDCCTACAVHTSMCTHVHAYVARVCDEMGLFLSHRLAHMHMYVFGAEKGVCKYVVDATVFDSRLAAIKALSWRCSTLAPHKKHAHARVLTYVCVSPYIYSSSWSKAQHWYGKLGRSRRAKVCMCVCWRMPAYGALVCEEIRLFWVID
jgi:hypothetical protein